MGATVGVGAFVVGGAVGGSGATVVVESAVVVVSPWMLDVVDDSVDDDVVLSATVVSDADLDADELHAARTSTRAREARRRG
ncbi:MAG TPA: hypothetical protein DCR14_05550 [Acidimicrobiaceae bacterium]|nr:hypothetical protein [Acidimicrobiaceae bacterium]